MNFEDDLYDMLATSATLAAVVSTRIYPLHRIQDGTTPVLVYNRVSGMHLDGMADKSNLERVRVQFDCYSTSLDTLRLEHDALLNTLHVADNFKTIASESPFDLVDDETGIYRRVQDVFMWHRHSRAILHENGYYVLYENGRWAELEGW